jgi:signal transduction histidine kinase
MTARTHPRPMLLVLAVRWIAVVWMATMALVGGQVLAERAWVTVLALVGTLAWTAWLTLAATRRVVPVLLVDLLVAVALVLVSGYVQPAQQVLTDHPTLVGVYPMVVVAAWAVVLAVRGGLVAGAVIAVALVAEYGVNQAPVGDLSYLQALHLVTSGLAYLLLGGTIGVATRQFDRVSHLLAKGTERVARLEERERLAARIHDDVLQQLGRIRCLGGELAERGHVRAPELRQLMAQVERQERALRSVFQHDGGTTAGGAASLLAALATLADTFPQWPVHLVGSGPVVLAEDVVVEIAAAVGELLGNVVKHAHADEVWVSVLETDGDVTVDVRDDGVGFDYDESALAGTGRLGLLVSVQARMARLGGTALVRGRPGRGAEIELCLRRST